jgi:hypothetical protein
MLYKAFNAGTFFTTFNGKKSSILENSSTIPVSTDFNSVGCSSPSFKVTPSGSGTGTGSGSTKVLATLSASLG